MATASAQLKPAGNDAGIQPALWLAFPVIALLLYRQVINVVTSAHGDGPIAMLAVAVAIAIPLTGLAFASRSGFAAFAAYLTLIIPPVFAASGGYIRIAGLGGYWTLLAVSVPIAVFGGGIALSFSPGKLLVKLHRTTAVALAVFVLAHLANHPFALDSLAAHKSVQDVLRLVYRNAFVEPLLVAALAAQAISGVALAWRGRHRQGFLNHAQAASGLFMAAFLCSHVMATLVSGRTLANTDTNFVFSAGGPAGLLHTAGAAMLIPYYFLAPIAFFTHVGGAVRRSLLRKRSSNANQVAVGLFATGVVLSLVILAALCGVGGISSGV